MATKRLSKTTCIAWLLAAACLPAQAVDFSGVPGTVLSYQPLQYDPLFSVVPRYFIADPEIAVLPNGDYVAAHTIAGNFASQDFTRIFRSSDQGVTWTSLGTLNGMYRGSLFAHGGHLYIYGAENLEPAEGKALIMRSSDNGTTWTPSPPFSFGGPATPNNPLVFNGRIWTASSRASVSAPVGADLLDPASWQIKYGFPDGTANPEWRSEGEFIGEGQIVASPEQGLVILPKVKDHAMTALGRVNATTGNVSFDPDNDFIALPGGGKKFGAAYDAVSGRFLILSNPILPAHYGSSIASDMMRNTLVLQSSEDLRNWKTEKIVLYSPDERREGFGYPNFDFDGDDLLIIVRTSMKLPGETWPGDTRGGHDSNLLTFHRLANFRTAAPDHFLAIDGNQVLRFERTQHNDAPLGNFARGTLFAGAPLTAPDGLGQDANGEVYIRESGGRILRFDATGNFLSATNAAPVPFQSAPLDVAQPADGTATWAGSVSGDWFDSANWHYWNRADTGTETAVFGSAIEAAASITVNEPYGIGGLRFLSAHDCTLAGSGSVTLAAESGSAAVAVAQGMHSIAVPVALGSAADFHLESGGALKVSGFALGGNAMSLDGGGSLVVDEGAFSMGGGVLELASGSMVFSNALTVFDGTIGFKAPEGFSPALGDSFQIMEGDIEEELFGPIVLPSLEEGLGWDTSLLFSNGTVSVALRIPQGWLAQYGLPLDGSADFADSDGDGMDNYSEWKAGTDPEDPESRFQLVHSEIAENGFLLRWVSLTGRTYRVEVSTNLMDSPSFWTIQTNLPGESGTMEFTDTNTWSSPSVFYKTVIE